MNLDEMLMYMYRRMYIYVYIYTYTYQHICICAFICTYAWLHAAGLRAHWGHKVAPCCNGPGQSEPGPDGLGLGPRAPGLDGLGSHGLLWALMGRAHMGQALICTYGPYGPPRALMRLARRGWAWPGLAWPGQTRPALANPNQARPA